MGIANIHFVVALLYSQSYFSSQNIPGIEGIDTRALTKVIRQHGTMLGRIVIVGPDR